MDKTLLLNVGLAVKGVDGGPAQYSKTVTLLRAIFGIVSEKLVTAQYGATVERTVVAQVVTDQPLETIKARLAILSDELEQDCVAVSTDDGKNGFLVGPRAAEYGDFNPDYFVK